MPPQGPRNAARALRSPAYASKLVPPGASSTTSPGWATAAATATASARSAQRVSGTGGSPDSRSCCASAAAIRSAASPNRMMCRTCGAAVGASAMQLGSALTPRQLLVPPAQQSHDRLGKRAQGGNRTLGGGGDGVVDPGHAVALADDLQAMRYAAKGGGDRAHGREHLRRQRLPDRPPPGCSPGCACPADAPRSARQISASFASGRRQIKVSSTEEGAGFDFAVKAETRVASPEPGSRLPPVPRLLRSRSDRCATTDRCSHHRRPARRCRHAPGNVGCWLWPPRSGSSTGADPDGLA